MYFFEKDSIVLIGGDRGGLRRFSPLKHLLETE